MAVINMTKTQQYSGDADGGVDRSDRSMLGLGLFLAYQDATLALEKLTQSGYLAHQLFFLARWRDTPEKGACQHYGSLSDGSDGSDGSDSSVSSSPGKLLTSASTSNSPYVGFIPAVASASSSDMLAGLTGLVDSVSVVTLPEIGPVIVGGHLGSLISPASDFKSTIAKALGALGLPDRSVALYSDRVKRGDCLTGLKGSSHDVLQAKQVLRHCRIIHWQAYKV